ncbi:MAG TPA: MaoC/PaaZ C-terminal domain-containing protein [Pseudonocardiaceae bacterium]|nr:MaoC/PaaZ C-terminal domain-containing protein [Pseudonocardiaceae bacterium]
MITDYFDRIKVGDQHVSRGRTVTETDIVSFAMLTGDWHPAHVDAEYAKNDKVFGQRVAHGALVLSIGLGLVTFWPEAIKAFYGIDKLRFIHPTVIGDTVHVETEVTGLTPRADDAGVVTSSFTVVNQRGAAVLVGTLKTLVVNQPAGAQA